MRQIPVSRTTGAIFGAAITFSAWQRPTIDIAFLAAAFAHTAPVSTKRFASDKAGLHIPRFKFEILKTSLRKNRQRLLSHCGLGSHSILTLNTNQ
jgi:hypothetical protein